MRSQTLVTSVAVGCIIAVCARGAAFPQVINDKKKEHRPGLFWKSSKRAGARYQSKNQVKQSRFSANTKSRGAFLLPQLLDGKKQSGVTQAGLTVQDQRGTNLQPTTPVSPLPPYPDLPGPPDSPDLVEPPLPDASGEEDVFDVDAGESELLLQSARNAVKLEKYNDAIARFTEYLRAKPNDNTVRLEVSGVLVQAGRQSAAAAQLEHLVQDEPDNFQYLREYSKLQVQLGQFAKAEESLLRLVEDPGWRVEAAVDLARLYASSNRVERAQHLYERILRFEVPTERRQRIRFAELLNDINRPGEAMDMLLQLRGENPNDLEVLKLIILASATAGDSSGTMDFISQLSSTQPENLAVRFQIADRLFGEGLYREAIMVDQQILSLDPTNVDAILRSAKSNLRLYDPASAQALLSGVSASDTDPEYQSMVAEYHSLVGEHADALAVLRRILAIEPGNATARLAMGRTLRRSGQLTHAASELASVQPDSSGGNLYLESQIERARTLAQSRQFGQATGLLESLYASHGDSDLVLDGYIDVFTAAEQYPAAIAAVRSAMNDPQGRIRRQVQLRSKLGVLMARSGDYAGALKELQAAEKMTTEPIPEIVYGQYVSHAALGNKMAAEAVLGRHLGVFGNDSYLRVRVSELAMEDCQCCLAQTVLLPLQSFCQGNALIANRLGEACMQCSSCDGSHDCSQYFDSVLSYSPSNVQAMMGLARINSGAGEYEIAERYYDRAMKHMPRNVGLVREVAQMMNQWHGPKASKPFYDRALQLASGQHLVEAAAQSHGSISGLEHEYQSLSTMNSRVSTEMASRHLGMWKPLSAISSYEGLLAMEPNNESAIFEIGQLYSQLNRTYDALEQYDRLLCINPCHREAQIAIARNEYETAPQFHVIGGYRSQRGRDDLASIDRWNVGGVFQLPLGDEDEFLQFGYTRQVLQPTNGPSIIGDIPSFRAQYKPIWNLLLWGQADYASFDSGFESRVLFDAGLAYRYTDNATVRAIGLRQNVAENGEAIQQDINRTGIEIGHLWRPLEPLRVDMRYRYWDYSDNNSLNEFGVHSGYQFFRGRSSLWWLLDFDYMSFREQTAFGPGGGLPGTVHPYFSPSNFGFVSTGVEVRHYVSCDLFKGANLHWYELFLGARLDTDGHGYGLARGAMQHDVNTRLSYSAFFNVIQSSVFDLTEAGVHLTYRF